MNEVRQKLLDKNKLIFPIKYIRRIAIAFSIMVIIGLLSLMASLIFFVRSFSIYFSISIILLICIICFFLSLNKKLYFIGLTILQISLQIFWLIYPYIILNSELSSIETLYITSISQLALVILSGLLIHKYSAFVFSITSIINISLYSFFFIDKLFLIYRLPFLLSIFAFFSILTYFLIYIQNRTSNKLKEYSESLKESEEKYRMIFNNSKDIIIVNKIDENNNPLKFEDINDLASQKLGYKKEELLNFTPSDLIDIKNINFDNVESNSNIIQKLIQDKNVIFETTIKTKDNHKIPVEVNSHFFYYKNKPTIISSVRDISERKFTEELLHKTETDYRLLFTNMLNGFAYNRIELDKDGKPIDYIYIEVNNAFEKIMGLKREDIIGKRFTEVMQKNNNKEEILWIGYYGRVALAEEDIRFEHYSKPLDKWFCIYAYCPKKFYFALILEDITDSRTAKEALAESENKYRNLFETLTDAILIEDPKNGIVIDCNSSACRIYGYPKEKIIGLSIFDLAPDDVSKKLKKSLANEIKKGGISKETFAKKKGGVIFPIELNTKVIKIKGKEVIIAYVHDISNRKETEKKLKEQKALLDELFNGIQEGIQILDENDYIIFCNPASEKIFEVENNNLTGRCIHDFLNEKAKKIVIFQSKKRKNNKTSTYELPIITDKGNYKYLRVIATPRFDSEGKFRGAFASFVDITEKRKIELELKESEEKYRALVENSNDAIILIQDTCLKFFNKKTLELLEYSKEEMQQKSILDITAPEDREQLLKRYLKIKNHKSRNSRYEIRTITKYGKRIWVGINAVNTMWKGEPAILAFIRDITQQKIVEAKLIEAKEEAIESSRLKGEFLANVSHELRTPLNAIMGLAQILNLKQDLDNESRIDLSKRILKSSKSLLNIISDILNLSSIEYGKSAIIKDYFFLEDLLNELIDTFEEKILNKGLEFNIKKQKNIPKRIFTDKQRLMQILSNLIDNAIKFTEKGYIHLNIEHIKEESGKACMLFSVIDSGIGIPDDKKHLLFEPFTQVDGSITRKYGGTGLGLSIVKKLTELLGGNVWLESEPDKGTTFYFTIDIYP